MVRREVELHVVARVVNRARLEALTDPSRDGRQHEEDGLRCVAVEQVQVDAARHFARRFACRLPTRVPLDLAGGDGCHDRGDEEQYGRHGLQNQRVKVVEAVADTVKRYELHGVEGEERHVLKERYVRVGHALAAHVFVVRLEEQDDLHRDKERGKALPHRGEGCLVCCVEASEPILQFINDRDHDTQKNCYQERPDPCIFCRAERTRVAGVAQKIARGAQATERAFATLATAPASGVGRVTREVGRVTALAVCGWAAVHLRARRVESEVVGVHLHGS
mmetsp:Transcript_93521/g.267588  ORF Transcript_93521/g.267588 Transcript_93521/m.267588 type:complete len:278 (+) Transcript_93521:450-1283(+)